jgi:hypothetical protein
MYRLYIVRQDRPRAARFTFKGAGRRSALRDRAWGLAALTVALCLTTVSMGGLRLLAPRAGLPDELAVLTAANLVATAVRFAALRTPAAASPAAALPAPPRLLRRTA